MMKRVAGSAILAWVVLGPALAQDGPAKEKPCGLANLVCPKGGHCEGDCRKMCDAAGEVLAAVRTRLHARFVQEYGPLLACTCSKDGSPSACATCDFLKAQVLIPTLKAKMEARSCHPGAPATHPVPGQAGKTDCSFPSSPACLGCVDELSNVLWEKMRMLLFDRLADFAGAVRAEVAIRVARAGAPSCECLKAPVPTRCSNPECESFKMSVVFPLFRQKAEARLKAWDESQTHTVSLEGKETSVPCTYLKGKVCWVCADQAAEQLMAKMAEIRSKK
jgi:hypothetical protein